MPGKIIAKTETVSYKVQVNGQIWTFYIDQLINDQGRARENTIPDIGNFEAVPEVMPPALGSKDIVIPQLEVKKFS